MAEAKKVAPAVEETARLLWREGRVPAAALQRMTNLSAARLKSYAAERGWGAYGEAAAPIPGEDSSPREAVCADETNADDAIADDAAAALLQQAALQAVQQDSEDNRAFARRIETAVRSEINAVEKRLGSMRASTAESNARTLASLVKSLTELRRLDGYIQPWRLVMGQYRLCRNGCGWRICSQQSIRCAG